MDPRAAEQAAGRLHRDRRFFVNAAGLAALSILATGVMLAVAPSAAGPLVLLTTFECVVATCAHFVYREEVQRLSLEAFAQEIPEVRSYCSGLLRQSRRDRLAASINSLITDAHLPLSFGLRDRIFLVEDQLRALAFALATPHVKIHSRSMVLCLQLMTNGVESPLYNSNLTVEQLRAVLMRIGYGIDRTPSR